LILKIIAGFFVSVQSLSLEKAARGEFIRLTLRPDRVFTRFATFYTDRSGRVYEVLGKAL
jgi:hypothetical protein